MSPWILVCFVKVQDVYNTNIEFSADLLQPGEHHCALVWIIDVAHHIPDTINHDKFQSHRPVLQSHFDYFHPLLCRFVTHGKERNKFPSHPEYAIARLPNVMLALLSVKDTAFIVLFQKL